MQEHNQTTARALRRSPRTLAEDRAGTAAVEFALVLPALLMILVGIIQFGVALNNYLELTDAVQAGDRNSQPVIRADDLSGSSRSGDQ